VQFVARKLLKKDLAGDTFERTSVTLCHVTANAHASLDDARDE
jgi:hypothetical protein